MAHDDPARTLQTIPFHALAQHFERQVRGKTNPATVNRYRLAMKNGDKFPPVLVADVDGALILIDGFHRRDAMEALGEWQAEVEVVKCASLDEAEWLAFDANLRHGQPLKAKALHPAFRAYVKAGRNVGGKGELQSYRGIALALPGVSYSTVRRWMQEDFPDVFVAMAGGGDDAEGGVRPSHRDIADAPYDLTMQALTLLDDAQALMEGVALPALRHRVAERAQQLQIALALTGAGADSGDEDSRTF